MNRFGALRLLTSFLLILAVTLSTSVQASTVFRIGVSTWASYPNSVRGFKEAMAEAGLVEGKNVEYLYRESGGDRDRQREIAHEFKAAGVDLVYSLTTPGTSIVKEVRSCVVGLRGTDRVGQCRD